MSHDRDVPVGGEGRERPHRLDRGDTRLERPELLRDRLAAERLAHQCGGLGGAGERARQQHVQAEPERLHARRGGSHLPSAGRGQTARTVVPIRRDVLGDAVSDHVERHDALTWTAGRCSRTCPASSVRTASRASVRSSFRQSLSP